MQESSAALLDWLEEGAEGGEHEDEEAAVAARVVRVGEDLLEVCRFYKGLARIMLPTLKTLDLLLGTAPRRATCGALRGEG